MAAKKKMPPELLEKFKAKNEKKRGNTRKDSENVKAKGNKVPKPPAPPKNAKKSSPKDTPAPKGKKDAGIAVPPRTRRKMDAAKKKREAADKKKAAKKETRANRRATRTTRRTQRAAQARKRTAPARRRTARRK